MPTGYLSTDPNAGTPMPTDGYLSTDPSAGEPAPNFRSENEKDSTGAAVVRGGEDRSIWDSLRDVVREGSQGVNPMNLNHALQQAFWHPIDTAKGWNDASTQLRLDAQKSFAEGDYATGSRKMINWLLSGLMLPMRLDQASDYAQQGEYAKSLGATIDVGLQAGLPSALARGGRVAPVLRNRVPAVQDAVAFGLREGIPVDAATASGNPFVRGVQRLTDESALGSVVGENAKHVQGEAFTRTGQRLMDRTHPTAVTAEQAGQGLRDATRTTMHDFKSQADVAYGSLRTMEANPFHGDYVPVDVSPAVKTQMREQLGTVPTSAELQELRRIREELDAVPFQAGKLSRDAGPGYDAGETTYSPRAAGAPVYHDILQEAPGTSSMTRAEVQASIDRALSTGRFTNAAKGALKVAQKRLGPGGADYAGMSRPILPPDAGTTMQGMAMPVDLRRAKAQLKPLYERLMRERELVGTLQGDKARVVTALDRLMTAPDDAPLSVVDGALSDLKSLARSNVPELRNAGQGAAAFAVKSLDAQVRAAATKAGPAALKALDAGRAATVAKYATADVLDALRKEPVGAYRQATAPRDAGVALLRELQKTAPAELPKVGRAVLEDLLTTATAEGGFHRAQGLLAKWQQLGSQTKLLLYRDPALIKDLDRFFLLAKKSAEHPNPSGTAMTAAKYAEGVLLLTNPATGVATSVSAVVLSKLLHSPRVVRALNRGFILPFGAKAAASAAVAEFLNAARALGVELAPAVNKQDPRELAGSTPSPSQSGRGAR
jgi:hypothetical protein